MELRIIISDRYNQKYCMSKREPHLLIKDIIDSAQKILEYTSGISFDDFSRDSKTIDAVIRNFENYWKASNRLSDQFKDQHTTVDWVRLRGFRNRIVNHYFGVDYSIV
jgi:uncharacterized protein with HEPN domain